MMRRKKKPVAGYPGSTLYRWHVKNRLLESPDLLAILGSTRPVRADDTFPRDTHGFLDVEPRGKYKQK